MARPLTLITGASSGLGREFARIAASRGHDLALVARSTVGLEAVRAELLRAHALRVHVFACDLAREGAVSWLLVGLAQRGLAVETLINNAGFGDSGAFVQLPHQRQIDMLRVNGEALSSLTRGLLPGMVERGRGGVLNVASLAAFQAGPGMAVYYASKAYVLHFSEALHDELAASGVKVSCLCPGPTRTDFARRSGMEKSELFRGGAADAAAVARFGWESLERNRAIAIPGLGNRLLALSTRLAPRALTRRLAARLNRRA